MAIPAAATGARHQRSEEADALYGVVVALTAASGGMIAVFAVLDGDVSITAVPTAAVLVGMARRSLPLTAWSGVGVWALITPMAPGMALLAPVLMGVACLAFAIGPGRLLDWVHDEWIGRMGDEPIDVGWIEDER
ncbi:MAG: hypothetical protein M3Y40_06920 [Chloroflexota bacterium]|nr:hypothetical protein [Chloroflexota bacterium]